MASVASTYARAFADVVLSKKLDAQRATGELRQIAELLADLSVRDAAAAVAAKHGLPRRQVYARALALAGAAR